MKAILPIPVLFAPESSLGYRIDFDREPLIMDRAFEMAGYDFVTLVIM